MSDSKLTIDQAYKKLQDIVKEFDSDEVDLEKSMPRFKEGLELASYLKEKLKSLKVEIEEIKDKFDKVTE